MFPGRSAHRRRVARVAALLLAAVWLLPATPASAITVEGSVADTIAGSSGAPAGTVLTLFVGAGDGTRVPRAVQFTVGQGLQLGASGPPCDLATVRGAPYSCAPAAQVGEGVIETTRAVYRISAFTLSSSALALRFETTPSPSLVDVTTAALDGSASTLTFALPPALQGEELVSLRLRTAPGRCRRRSSATEASSARARRRSAAGRRGARSSARSRRCSRSRRRAATAACRRSASARPRCRPACPPTRPSTFAAAPDAAAAGAPG